MLHDVKELRLKGTREVRAPRGAETEWRNGDSPVLPFFILSEDEPYGRSARWMQSGGERAGQESYR